MSWFAQVCTMHLVNIHYSNFNHNLSMYVTIIILCFCLERQLVQRFHKGWVRKLLGPAALKGCLHVNISVAPRYLLNHRLTTGVSVYHYQQIILTHTCMYGTHVWFVTCDCGWSIFLHFQNVLEYRLWLGVVHWLPYLLATISATNKLQCHSVPLIAITSQCNKERKKPQAIPYCHIHILLATAITCTCIASFCVYLLCIHGDYAVYSNHKWPFIGR